ncbi:MAG: hypothetical protein H8E64_06690 [Candidatus Marinimicrobia bacterium]|nr:hypothetical protein [Candidatus Neomarinimicrobiota bacterium]
MKNGRSRITLVLYLMLVGLCLNAVDASDRDKHISFVGGMGIPIGGLNEWYNLTPSIGIQTAYYRTPESKVVFSFHFQKFIDGSIKDKTFQWMIDYEQYNSPKADAFMIWNDFIVKFQKTLPHLTFSVSGKTFSTFSSLGFGFYNYTHHVSGLIYPGQPKAPLDEDFLMDPISDRRVAWGACAGIGTELPISELLKVSVLLEYNSAIGFIRAFEDWGLYEVAPLQFLNLGIGVAYLY